MLETNLDTTSKQLNFERELKRFGPHQSEPVPLAVSQSYCSQWATSHYENFVVASLLLPRRLRQDFHNIYAYCRWSDNLADEIADPHRSLALLDWWQQQLDLCWHGQPAHPVMVALQQTVRRHALCQQPFADLLVAFRQDRRVHRYRDDDQLLDYCGYSANPVGRIVLQLAKADTPESRSLSDQICTGLQLANFCQDLARDAEQGRIYLPQSRWASHGVDESMLLRREPTKQMRAAVAAWVSYARSHLLAGAPLIGMVPGWLRADVRLFIGGGLAILTGIARHDFDVWSHRPRVSKWTQVRLLCGCWLPRLGTRY